MANNAGNVVPAGMFEPSGSAYEPEHRYRFTVTDPSGPHVVIQGSVTEELPYVTMKGNEDEEWSNEYEVRLLVGPFWKHVGAVVPNVTINGFYNWNADEDDEQLWEILDLTWDTVNEFGPSHDELRIRLKFKVRVRGARSRVIRIGYYVFARGRGLGEGGVNEPGPVRQQG